MKNMTFSKESMSVAALALLAVFGLAGCGSGGGGDFPVNEAVATELISKGVPADIARFFAAAKLESNCSTDRTCTYLQTFPNGATREMTLSASPNLQYTPTADELARTTPGSSPLYDVKFASSGMADSTTQIDMSYFVPTSSIPKSPAQPAQASSLTTEGARRAALMQLAAGAGATDGAAINWTESGKKGADVAIGSILEHYAATGKTAPALGSVYALASAASDVTGALDLSKQTNAWLAELDALEQCAANPTNPLTQTDPNYSATTVAIVQSARVEIKANGAVRYLNIMQETAMGLHPVLAVLSIPLKQVNLWNDETSKYVSEITMREARLAVVSCEDKTAPTVPANLAATAVSESQIDLVWSASTDLYGVTGYKVYRYGTYLKSVTGTSSSDTGLTANTQYCYEVSAYDAANNESAKSSSVSGFQQCATTLPATLPTVVSTSPAAGATDAGIIPTIMVTFSKAMDPATITTASLTVTGKTVLFAYYHAATNTAEFTLSTSLTSSTDYTATVNTGVKDTMGNALATAYTWSFRTGAAAGTTNMLVDVIWSGTQFVAVGLNGTILTSPTGSVWTVRTSGTTDNLFGVTWSGTQFVAVGNNVSPHDTILTSPTGSVWTAQTSGTTTGGLTDVTWSGTQYVAVGLGFVLTSSNGTAWTVTSDPTTNPIGNLWSVTWNGTQYLATTDTNSCPVGNAVFTSSNGTSWTCYLTGLSSDMIMVGVAWSGTQYVGVAVSTTPGLSYGATLTSPNGAVWTVRASSSRLFGVTWSGTQYVAVGDLGAILTSPNGVTWTAQASGTANLLRNVTWSGTQYAAVGSNGTILTSPDGVTWTAR